MIVQELVSLVRFQLHRESFYQIHRALRSVKAAMEETGLAMEVAFGVGALVAGASLAALTIHTALSIDKMGDLADKLGLTVQQLNELAYAGKQNAITLQELETGYKQFSRNLGDAALGAAPKMLAKFQQMGVAVKEAGKVRAPLDVMLDLADAFHKMGDGHEAQKMAVALKLFGRTGENFMQMFNKGRPEIERLMGEFRELGGTITPQMRKEAGDLHTQWDKLTTAFGGLTRSIVGPWIPKMTKLLEGLTKAVVWLRKVVEGSNGALEKLKFIVMWLTTFWILRWIALLPSLGSMLDTVGLKLVKWLWSMNAALAALSWEMLVAQLRAFAFVAGLVAIAAIVALVANDLYVFATGGDSAFGRFLNWVSRKDWTDSPFVEMLKSAIGFMTDLGNPAALQRLKAAWEGFKPVFMEFGAWMAMGFLEVAMNALGMGNAAGRTASIIGAVVTPPDQKRGGLGGVMDQLLERGAAIDRALGFRATAPSEIGRNAGAAPNMSMSLTVQVPPGSDGHAIGATVMSHIKDGMASLQAAYAGAH